MTSKMPADRIAFGKPIAEILEKLHTPVPERLTEVRRQGNAQLRYLPWYHACRLLEYYAPGWEGRVVSVQQVSDFVVVVYEITIQTSEGSVTRQATGQAKLGEFGDPVCNAEAQAFKRAAAKFGLGLDLYEN